VTVVEHPNHENNCKLKANVQASTAALAIKMRVTEIDPPSEKGRAIRQDQDMLK
jgi:hypothetical protein